MNTVNVEDCEFHLTKLRRISDDICLVINIIEDTDLTTEMLREDLVRHLRYTDIYTSREGSWYLIVVQTPLCWFHDYDVRNLINWANIGEGAGEKRGQSGHCHQDNPLKWRMEADKNTTSMANPTCSRVLNCLNV